MNFFTSILCITQLHWLNNLFTATVSLSAVSRNTAGAQWSLLFDIVQKIKSHVCLLDKPNLIQTIKLMTHMLKVSKFQKENMKSSHFPKTTSNFPFEIYLPLVAHFHIFRLFMKGNFDGYVLWPLDKMVQNWIVD